MISERWKNMIARSQTILWVIFLLALPITSFPYIPAEFGGRTLVRPLSIYPLLILVVILMLPRLFRLRLPLTFLPLFAFIAIALISTVLSLSLEIEAYRGVTVFARVLRNMVTLAMGASIYFTVVLYNRKWEDLQLSLRWLYAGMAVALSWATLQAIYVVWFNDAYYDLLNQVHKLFSTQELNTTRISGMTFEPKWFAEQIVFLLMPWLLGSVFSRRSLFEWRYKFVTLEMIMLIWAGGLLTFTFSRTGFAVFALLIFLSFLLSWRFRSKRLATNRPGKHSRGLRVAEAALAMLLAIGIFVGVGVRNPYFSRIWRYWTSDQPQNKSFLEYIAFSQRFTYAETALRIFEDYPVFGVGLGNYAFYFTEKLPNREWNQTPEIIRQITPSERGPKLITPKNMIARLMAETGLLGTSTFLAFVLAIMGNAFFIWFIPSSPYRFWGLASLLGVAAFMLLMFSTDSFANPNLWVVFGFITAAAHLASAETVPTQSPALTHTEQDPQLPLTTV